MQISEYFRNSELKCRCGCGLLPSPESVRRLYALRLLYDSPMVISSAARCEAHNSSEEVGGSDGSIHLPPVCRKGPSQYWRGGAFDILNPSNKGKLIRLAISVGFKGIGIGDTFIHIDDALRGELTVWTY